MSQEMLVDIQNLTIRFGRKVVVNDLSLQVAEGERIAIVGESGSGKTLTGLSLIGLLPEGGDVTGSVSIKI
ncbi:MAG: ATP-binding cassette domain-containing protein, partial [Polynucleobacter victoriensis]